MLEQSIGKINNESKENGEWQIYVLMVDDISREIADFFKKEFEDIKAVDLAIERDHKKEELEGIVKNSVRKHDSKKILSVYGSGGFHHLTYGLCQLYKSKKRKGYIHFDAHRDNTDHTKNEKDKTEERLWCGGFVNQLCNDASLDMLHLGSKCSEYNGLTCSRLHQAFGAGNLELVVKSELHKLPDEVYISLDLDFMDKEEIITDYPQGSLRLNELLAIINIIQKEKNIFGADILGLSNELTYLNKINEKDKGNLLYSTIASKLLDHNSPMEQT